MYKYIGKANKNNMQTSNINQQVRLGNPERYIWYKYLEFLKERKENEQDMIFLYISVSHWLLWGR
jgi:hypothetical protein